jgi:hypothetical protein
MAAKRERRTSLRAGAMRFVVLIGVVSLFADMTYEGARAITGPYLAILGAGSTVVGFVAGSGELLGYTLRIASGRLADLTPCTGRRSRPPRARARFARRP